MNYYQQLDETDCGAACIAMIDGDVSPIFPHCTN